MASLGFGGGSPPSSGAPHEPIEKCTPWIAAGDGDLHLLQTALEELNLPANAVDSNGFTFVHAAASYSQMEVLRWLLGRGGDEIDVNAGDSDGDTPLHHCDDVAAARFLVEEGRADPSRRNNEGMTAKEAKEEELAEGDDDDEDEDREKLKELVAYLIGLEGHADVEDTEMR